MPQLLNPAIYSTQNQFNGIFYPIWRPKEQLTNIKFKGLKKQKTYHLQECCNQQSTFA